MPTSPRQKAERCFAIARSTNFAGERAAAIARGIAIAEKAGLDLGRFDIPGRPQSARQGLRSDSPEGIQFYAASYGMTPWPAGRAPPSYTAADVADLMRHFRRHEASKSTR